VTDAVRLMLPPVPLHWRLYVRLLVMPPAVQPFEASGREPLHDPDAIQLVALVVAQRSTVLPPLATLVGFALKVSVGAAEPLCTVTLAERWIEPPPPEHVSVYVRLLVMPPAVQPFEASGREPLQDPDAVQLVALVVAQRSTVLPPLATLVGFALKVSVGAAEPLCTVTLAERWIEPPPPEHVNVYVRLLVMPPAVQPFEASGREPLQDPDAVQLVALVVDQRSTVLPPLAILVGFALNVRVGACVLCTVTRAVELAAPAVPVQVSMKSADVLSGPTLWEPETALFPAQPPEAEQEVALVADQVRVLVCPLVTAVGLALIWTAGRLAVAVAGHTAHCGASP
jgi:hypothetical protein